MRGGDDREKIEKECWSGSVDCLSLLQICYFYINSPLVMKAILFCNENYFRYVHEVGGNFWSGHKDHLFLDNK